MKFLFWLKNSWEKILAVGWRLIVYEIFNLFFNYPLYGWVMYSLGLGRGWLMMTGFSLIQCAALFWYYDKAKVDWLFADTARSWENGTTENSSWFRKIAVRISKSRDTGIAGISTFILASINLDPVMVAVHYRKNHFCGINFHDWSILIASVAIGNLWWGFRIGLFVEVLKWLFRHL
jgi:hypothetical protein